MRRIVIALLLLAAAPAGAVQEADALAEDLARAQAQLEAGDPEGALALIGRVLEEDPGSADALNLLGFARRRAGDLEGAATAYEAALAIRPDHRGALEYQGELFLMTGDRAAAEANLARLTAICGGCEEREELAAALAADRAADPGPGG